MSNSKDFYLYPRAESGIYYVYYKHPVTGKKMSGKSTHTRDKNEANYIAMKWLREGFTDDKTESLNHKFDIEELLNNLNSMEELNSNDAKKILKLLQDKKLIGETPVLNKSDRTFLNYLTGFWDYEKSKYVKEKHALGQSLGRRRCSEALGTIIKHWEPFFKEKLLSDIRRADIKAFQVHLGEKDLAAKTKNNILNCGTVALNWAFANDQIGSDTTLGLMKFSGDTRQRGILSEEETFRLFTEGDWKNNIGARLASLVAMQTGMRGGEVLALRVKDLKDERLLIKKSFSEKDGLKKTKTGNERETPLLQELRNQLTKFTELSPHKYSENNYIFFQMNNPNKPMAQSTLTKRLGYALNSIGINEETRKDRNIVFHSWRHFFAKNMLYELDLKTMKLLGQTTQAVFETYSNHKEEQDFQAAQQAVENKFSDMMQKLNKDE